MSSVEELTAAVATAKAAYKADKANKSLKTAHKQAKAALAAAVAAAAAKAAKKAKKSKKSKKRKATDAPAAAAPVAKKAKAVDVDALKAAATAAKAAYKANKADASLKAAYKQAKAAHAAAVAAAAAAPAAEEPAAMEEAEEEAAPSGGLAGLVNNKNKPIANPTATPKIFCGNLSWDIDDDGIKEFFKDCGETTDVFWLTDRDSGKFKGCGFITFTSPEAAALAVAKNGEDLMGRPIKVDFATPKPGGSKKSFGTKPMSEKPEGCNTCFVGNLSYEIDDDAVYKFAEEGGCGAIAKIRWLTDRETGDFKGCGFVEFESEDSVDKFALLNGKSLLGRNIRIDYAKPREKKW